MVERQAVQGLRPDTARTAHSHRLRRGAAGARQRQGGTREGRGVHRRTPEALERALRLRTARASYGFGISGRECSYWE